MLKTLFERGFIVLLVLLFCQFPLFIQQYETRLSGHVIELNRFVSSLEKSAQSSKKSLPEYIRKFSSHKDADIASQGRLLEDVVERYKSLQSGLAALQASTIWTRPFVFIRHISPEIFKETMTSFQPGLSMNFEALFYGAMGLLFGSLLLMLLGWRVEHPNPRP